MNVAVVQKRSDGMLQKERELLNNLSVSSLPLQRGDGEFNKELKTKKVEFKWLIRGEGREQKGGVW